MRFCTAFLLTLLAACLHAQDAELTKAIAEARIAVDTAYKEVGSYFSDVRTFADKSGTRAIQGSLKSVDEGKVRIELLDGSEKIVPVDLLSELDQKFVRNYQKFKMDLSPVRVAQARIDRLDQILQRIATSVRSSPKIDRASKSVPSGRVLDMDETLEDFEDIRIELDGKTWTCTGPIQNRWRFEMNATGFRCDSDVEKRLVMLLLKPGRDPNDASFTRMLFAQVKRDGNWIDEGRHECWLGNGDHYLVFNVNGEPHGEERVWYGNGALKRTTIYNNGKRTRQAFQYYDDGKIEWEAFYLNDKEIYGVSYDRDGNER